MSLKKSLYRKWLQFMTEDWDMRPTLNGGRIIKRFPITNKEGSCWL